MMIISLRASWVRRKPVCWGFVLAGGLQLALQVIKAEILIESDHSISFYCCLLCTEFKTLQLLQFK